MSTESNKVILRRLDDEVFNHGNLSIIDEAVSADFVNHDPFPGEPPGREGFKQIVTMLRAGPGGRALYDARDTHRNFFRIFPNWSAGDHARDRRIAIC
jgi:hypothetical protein